MTRSNKSWLPWSILLAAGLALFLLKEERNERPPQAALSPATPQIGPVASKPIEPPVLPVQKTSSAHHAEYAAVENGVYFYVAEVAKNEREAGYVAGDTIGFRYFGKSDEGEHLIIRVLDNGDYGMPAFCADPCKVIRYANGKRIVFDSRTIIGAAFLDAMRGKLRPTPASQAQRQEPKDDTIAPPTISADEPYEPTNENL